MTPPPGYLSESTRVRARHINRLVDEIRRRTPISHPRVRWQETSEGFVPVPISGRARRGQGATVVNCPWQILATSHTILRVRIDAGRVIFGTKVAPAPAAYVSIAGGTATSPVYVVLDYVLGAATATILGNSTNQYPTPSAGRLFIALHSFYVSAAGRVVHVKQHQFSDIIVSTFAA